MSRSRKPKSSAAARRSALRLQRDRANPALIVSYVEAAGRREQPLTTSTQPITDAQRLYLGDLRRKHNLPRHGIPALTMAQAAAEIQELRRRE